MNRTLRRPMFRRGGSTGTGITSGLDKPRQQYSQGTMPYNMADLVKQSQEQAMDPNVREAYQPYFERPKREAFNRFLMSTGLDLMGRPSTGNIFQTAALSAKGPTEQLFKDIDSQRLSKKAAEADLFKTLLQGNIDIASEAAGNEAGPAKTYKEIEVAKQLESLIPKIYDIEAKVKEGTATDDDMIELDILKTQRNNYTKSNPITEGAIDIFIKSSEGQTLFGTISERLQDKNPGKYEEGDTQLIIDVVNEIKKILGQFSSGGRAEYQMGGGVDMAQQPMMSQQPMMMPQEPMTMDQGSMDDGKNNLISYDQLRARLPNEITDDIVELMSNSAEALEDFAMISSQQDVTQFNKKYSVNLVLPSEA
jgi:hypothetical protein